MKGVEMTGEQYESPAVLKAEVRHLKWKLKLLGKQAGRQGETIYRLRNENAALREAVQFGPGDRARLYENLREQVLENRKLRQQLDAERLNRNPETKAILDMAEAALDDAEEMELKS